MNAARNELLGQHAVVVGGSMAGLMAARVLSNYYARVTLYEADALPNQAIPRKRVPQGSQAHALQAGGSRVIRDLNPGIHEDLVNAGARYVDAAQRVRIFYKGVWFSPIDSGLMIYVLSRPLEDAIRKYTLALPNIEMKSNCAVSGYIPDDTNQSITGIRLKQSNEGVQADLIVDAGGRGSGACKWLKQLGLEAPTETTVGIDIGYVSFIVNEPPKVNPNWDALAISHANVQTTARTTAHSQRPISKA